MRASRAPSAAASAFSSADSPAGAVRSCRDTCDAPYGVPPVSVVLSADSVYGMPTIIIP
ncbi:hypothetical protein BST28156_06643 [Burkholderia stagnalis]|nr:hypothetical protein BST28156_06643 [Burkholderia stagnalis]